MSAIARNRMKDWEVIADNLRKPDGVSAINSHGANNLDFVDAHRDDGKRFIVTGIGASGSAGHDRDGRQTNEDKSYAYGVVTDHAEAFPRQVFASSGPATAEAT